MILFAWLVFGIINAVILTSLDTLSTKKTIQEAILLGITGAVSGGLFAYLLFSGANLHILPSSLILLTLNCMALVLLIRHRVLRGTV